MHETISGAPKLCDERFRPFDGLTISIAEATQRGITPGQLTLHRLWPRSAEVVELEYRDGSGRTIPAQWFGSGDTLAHVAQATERVAYKVGAPPPWILPERQLLLQPGGVDRRMPELAKLLLERTTQLVVHRPERRAVVRVEEKGKLCYAKVVRPERAAILATVMQQIHQLAGDHFETPTVQAVDETRGVIYLSALSGQSLHAMLDHPDLSWAAHEAEQILRRLHTLLAPPSTQTHGAEDEVAVIEQWLNRLRWLAPAAADLLWAYHHRVCVALKTGTSPAVLLHRDFYDKQIFIGADGKSGVLDFDLLAVGEAALDVANALVHLELRAIQGQCGRVEATKAIAAFLNAYRPPVAVQQRLQSYADATRLRLAAIYGCRPYGVSYVPALLGRIGKVLIE